MKKILASVVITLLLLTGLAAAGVYWALQGPYASELVNRVLAHYSDYPISVRSAEVRLPNHVLLHGISIEGVAAQPVEIERAELWLNSDSFSAHRPVIDSLLLSGLSLQHGLPEQLPQITSQLTEHTVLHQLAIASFDYSDGEVIIRDGSIQIKQPRFDTPQQRIPFGTIQFSAEQIYWQGEAINQVLLDGDHLPDNSIIYGLSFQWRDGQFSGQAEQQNDGWSLVNATVDSLRLDPELPLALPYHRLLTRVSHIDRLDILDSTLNIDGMALTNLDLSAENLNWPLDLQTQAAGYLSLDAESIRYLGQLWLEPALELSFAKETLQLNDFSSGFRGGEIQAKATFTPGSAHFSELSLSGIKWFAEQAEDTQFLQPLLSRLDHLDIDNLNIKYSQFIQLARQPNWQVSGFSAEGKQLELIRAGKPGLWNGQLTLNAASASVEEVVSAHPIVRMESKSGEWRLNQAILPLEHGLLEAWGQYNFNLPSQPWQLEVSADGLPFSVFAPRLPLPVELDAITEFQLRANGLAGDELMLRHSLSGTLQGSLREAVLTTHSSETAMTIQPIDASEVHINVNRGRVAIAPVTFTDTVSSSDQGLKGNLTGELDLVHPEDGSIQLLLTEPCQETVFELVADSMQHTSLCD